MFNELVYFRCKLTRKSVKWFEILKTKKKVTPEPCLLPQTVPHLTKFILNSLYLYILRGFLIGTLGKVERSTYDNDIAF